MSALTSIYTALEGKTVTVGTITPQVKGLSTVRTSIDSLSLPCRLLLPVSPRLEGRDGAFIALGTIARVTWNITDLMLWSFVDAGMGIQSWADDLVGYCAAYAEVMRTFRSPAAQCALEGWTMTPGVFEYPSGSGRWYAGVECNLEITEVLSG